MIRRRVLILIAVFVFMLRAGRCQSLPTDTEWQEAVAQGQAAVELDVWSQAVNGSGVTVLSANVSGTVEATAGYIAVSTGSLMMSTEPADEVGRLVSIPPGLVLEPIIGQPGTYRMEYEVETTQVEVGNFIEFIEMIMN